MVAVWSWLPSKFAFYQLSALCHLWAEAPAKITASSQEPK